MGVEWPCLSLDFLSSQIPKNSSSASMFPLSVYMVAGSQAERPKDNKLYVMKASQLHRTKHDDDNGKCASPILEGMAKAMAKAKLQVPAEFTTHNSPTEHF